LKSRAEFHYDTDCIISIHRHTRNNSKHLDSKAFGRLRFHVTGYSQRSLFLLSFPDHAAFRHDSFRAPSRKKSQPEIPIEGFLAGFLDSGIHYFRYYFAAGVVAVGAAGGTAGAGVVAAVVAAGAGAGAGGGATVLTSAGFCSSVFWQPITKKELVTKNKRDNVIANIFFIIGLPPFVNHGKCR
jgi:hypothetical protein